MKDSAPRSVGKEIEEETESGNSRLLANKEGEGKENDHDENSESESDSDHELLTIRAQSVARARKLRREFSTPTSSPGASLAPPPPDFSVPSATPIKRMTRGLRREFSAKLASPVLVRSISSPSSPVTSTSSESPSRRTKILKREQTSHPLTTPHHYGKGNVKEEEDENEITLQVPSFSLDAAADDGKRNEKENEDFSLPTPEPEDSIDVDVAVEEPEKDVDTIIAERKIEKEEIEANSTPSAAPPEIRQRDIDVNQTIRTFFLLLVLASSSLDSLFFCSSLTRQ